MSLARKLNIEDNQKTDINYNKAPNMFPNIVHTTRRGRPLCLPCTKPSMPTYTKA